MNNLRRALSTMYAAQLAQMEAKTDEIFRRYGIRVEALKIIGREQWGASYGVGHPLVGPVRHVIIHHYGSPHAEPDLSTHHEMGMTRGVEAFHKNDRGWAGIAYNFVVYPSGRIHEGRGWGRVGAHAGGMNSKSVGIAFGMDAENHAPTAESMDAARLLIQHGVSEGHIRPDYQVSGHRDHKGTECPGDKLYGRLEELGS